MECDAVARRRGPLIRFLQTAQGRECLRAWSLNSEFILRVQQNYAAYNALVSRFDKAYRDPRSRGTARERSVNTMPYAICIRQTGGPEGQDPREPAPSTAGRRRCSRSPRDT